MDSGHPKIFKGLSFFIVQRCPQRSTFCNNVKKYGGKLVVLDNKADIIIADHAKKQLAPPDSYSFTWIEACIREGQLVDKDKYRAGYCSTSAPIRPVGGSQPYKAKGRNPFTKEDDEFLLRWVLQGEKDGGALRGNELYMQLEQVNTRHPWQSWRDRYVKYVSRTVGSSLQPLGPSASTAPWSSLEQRTAPSQDRRSDSIVTKPLDSPARRAQSTVDASQPITQVPQPKFRSPRRTAFDKPASPRVKSVPDGDTIEKSVERLQHPEGGPEHFTDRSQGTANTTTVESPRHEGLQTSEKDMMQTPHGTLPILPISPAWCHSTGIEQTDPVSGQPEPAKSPDDQFLTFDSKDRDTLFFEAHGIQATLLERLDEAWEDFAFFHKEHSAYQWRAYYALKVKADVDRMVIENDRLAAPHREWRAQNSSARTIQSSIDVPIELRNPHPVRTGIVHDPQVADTASRKRKNGSISPVETSDSDVSHETKRRKANAEDPESSTGSLEANVSTKAGDLKSLEVINLLDSGDEVVMLSGFHDHTVIKEETKDDSEGAMHDESQYEIQDIKVRQTGSHNTQREPQGAEALHTEENDDNHAYAESEELDNPTRFTSSRQERVSLSNTTFNQPIGIETFESNQDDQISEDSTGCVNEKIKVNDHAVVGANGDSSQAEPIIIGSLGQTPTPLFLSSSESDDSSDEHARATSRIVPSVEVILRPETRSAEIDEIVAEPPLDIFDIPSTPPASSHDGPWVLGSAHVSDHASQSRQLSDARSDEMIHKSNPLRPTEIGYTQDLLDRETQELFLDMELPDGLSDLLSASQPNSPHREDETFLTSAPQKINDLELIELFTQRQMRRGYTEKEIYYALERTSMFSDLAEDVLPMLQSGRLPAGLKERGVWTEKDDLTLRGGDAKALKRLYDFHGKAGFDERVQLMHDGLI